MATAGTHNYRIFMERGLPPVQSITRRWLRGSLMITICILAAALGLFLYYSHQNLYGGVQRAMQARFSTVEGRLQATGTAGSSQGYVLVLIWHPLLVHSQNVQVPVPPGTGTC